MSNQQQKKIIGGRDLINIHNMKLALAKITAIAVANGEGKTTFLNCLCGLERRSKDDIIIDGIKTICPRAKSPTIH